MIFYGNKASDLWLKRVRNAIVFWDKLSVYH